MGITLWGSNGGYQGKNGANIGKWVRGRYEIGPLHHPTQVPPTITQVNQRLKFGVTTSWLKGLIDVINPGFDIRKSKEQTAWNAAVSYNMDFAVIGTAPNYEINPPAVMFAKGRLTRPAGGQVTALADQKIEFEWDTWFNTGSSATDQVNLVVYNVDKDMFVVMMNAAVRSAGTYEMQLPLFFSTDQVHCYLSVLAANGKKSSDSLYIGMLNVL